METKTIYKFAEENNIEIYYVPLPLTHCVSLNCGNDEYCIGIDPASIDSREDEIVKLSHDIGHCVTGSFYNRYSPLDIKEKHEYRADKWAIKKLIPLDELKTALNSGYIHIWELAEYFSVTEPFVNKALRYYEWVLTSWAPSLSRFHVNPASVRV